MSLWVRAVCQGIRHLGINVENLLSEVGISKEQVMDPDACVEIERMAELWERSRELSRRDDIGLVVAGSIQPGNLHSLEFALFTSSCLEDFLIRARKYFAVVTDVARLRVEEHEKGKWFCYERVDGSFRFADEAVDAALGTIVVWLRYVISADYAPEVILLQRKRPGCPDAFERFFGCPVVFQSERNAILISHDTFRVPFPNANSALCAVHEALLDKQLERSGINSFVQKVRNRLVSQLPSAEFSQEGLAASLNMSVSTLHRRLKAEQSGYRKILEEVRQDLATYYLGHSTESISEIAYHLGFNDVSNFSHAFFRWFNVSPRDYRKRSVDRSLSTGV